MREEEREVERRGRCKILFDKASLSSLKVWCANYMQIYANETAWCPNPGRMCEAELQSEERSVLAINKVKRKLWFHISLFEQIPQNLDTRADKGTDKERILCDSSPPPIPFLVATACLAVVNTSTVCVSYKLPALWGRSSYQIGLCSEAIIWMCICSCCNDNYLCIRIQPGRRA